MAKERLTDEEFNMKVETFKKFDEQNDGSTTYLKSFLERQDQQEAELNAANLHKEKKEPWEIQLAEDRKGRDPNAILDQRLLDAEFGTGKKDKPSFSISGFLKGIIFFPIHIVYDFFEWYVDSMTLMKGITLFFFALTTIFCGWIAFLKVTEAFCIFMCLHTPFFMITPFDSADYFPWILLAVVWVLPFLLHLFGKYVFVLIPIVVLALVAIELIIGDPFLTDAFIALLDGLMKKL